MARTSKLSDLHYILLATAANHAGGNMLPPSVTIKQERANIMKSIATLIRRSLAEEVATKSAKNVWREADGQRFAVIITDAGCAALGVTYKVDARDTHEGAWVRRRADIRPQPVSPKLTDLGASKGALMRSVVEDSSVLCRFLMRLSVPDALRNL